MNRPLSTSAGRRSGLAIVVVIWAIAITGLLTSSLMVFSGRQSMLGTEVQNRVAARWAARAGVEATIAKLAEITKYPDPDDALLLYLVMEQDGVARGETNGASWNIEYSADGKKDFPGPMDEHSKLNVNNDALRPYLNILFYPLSFGVYDSINDWIDADDDPSALGVERDWYLSLDARYEPRNGPIWHVAEMELIAGVDPEDVRGEDWNLNNRMDASENDGMETLPIDEPNDFLEAGWSEFLTARSHGGGLSTSGQERIWLQAAEPLDIIDRIETLTLQQAQSLISQAQDPDWELSSLVLANPPPDLQRRNRFQDQNDDQQSQSELTFDPEQIALILGELTTNAPHRPSWGKLNINTVPSSLLYEVFQDEERLVDDILAMRARRAEGIITMMDLWELPDINEELMSRLLTMFDTHSNVFTIISKGKSPGSQQEVEMIVVVDRSTIPVQILEYREN
ncbi:MAG: hypothetical protein CMJ40_01625 [Phycisphaerae bacterium]|nr:hypothetical protein [Phycisphaerae bacterium]